jgi:Rrf2 family protein
LSESYDSGPLKRKQIAERRRISEAYLVNILLILKRAGIVASLRGRNGGYVLTRSPFLIRVGEIVEALDGQVDPAAYLAYEGRGRVNDPATGNVWKKLRELQREFLYSITLEDVVKGKF